ICACSPAFTSATRRARIASASPASSSSVRAPGGSNRRARSRRAAGSGSRWCSRASASTRTATCSSTTSYAVRTTRRTSSTTSTQTIGPRYDSHDVRNFRDRYPLVLEEQDGWPAFRTRAGLVTPVEVATHLLDALVTGTGIDPKTSPVTVTVPAAFAAPQREATIDAAANAGLGMVRLLDEPLATAHAYIA